MSDVLLNLEAHMQKASPIECVGLLLQNDTVVELYNQAQSSSRFFVNPQQLLEQDDLLSTPVSALYHSHPERSAQPSGEDERMMRYLITVWPDAYHIILSPHGHRAYHVVEDSICERKLPW